MKSPVHTWHDSSMDPATDEPSPLAIDLSDFDAVGITADVVMNVRSHAISAGVDTSATIDAPEGWHRVMVNASPTGKTLLRVRFVDLTRSRANNVSAALVERGWQLDEDRDGASLRYPSGVEATTIAFDVLATVTLAGAPIGVRTVVARDSTGGTVAL